VIEIEAAAVEELKKVKAQMHDEAKDGAALAKDTQKIVDIAKKASNDISAVKLTTEGLEPHVKAYTDMLDVVVAANKEVVDALEKAGDYSGSTAQAAQQAFRQTQHDVAVACGRRAPECEKLEAATSQLNETMSKLEQPKADELGKSFSGHLAELKAIDLEDEVVKKAGEAYIESIEELVRLVGIEGRITASPVNRPVRPVSGLSVRW
jgi:phage-related tail protein